MPRFYPLLPSLLVLALAAVCGWSVLRLARRLRLPEGRRRGLTGLCLAAILLAAIMILNLGFILKRDGGRQAELVFLVDGSASMGIRDMPGGQSRFEAAVAAARRLHGQSGAGWNKHCFLFNGSLQPAKSPDDWANVSPEGATDLAYALMRLHETVGTGATVVLFSDGLAQAPTAAPSGLDLYAVAVGTEGTGFPDLALGEIRAPEVMRAGDGCDFAIPVELRGYAEEKEIPLAVTIDGRPATELRQRLQPNGRALFSCRTDFKEAGIHTVRFALPQGPDELTAVNNGQTLFLEVRDDRRETLLCYPVLNAGFRPLLRMLGAQDTMALYRLNNRGVWQAVAPEGQGAAFKDGFPSEAAALRETDLIILGSTRAADYTPQERAVLARYTEEGGTLIALAGAEGAFEADGDATWEALMPARSGECRMRTGLFQVIPPAADTSPLAELARQTPEVTDVNAVEQMKDGAAALLSVRGERDYPLLLSMPYGQGRVFALMSNPVASWGGSAERSASFRRFWAQLLAEADDGRNEHLKVALTSNLLREGERIGLTVTPPDARYEVEAQFRPEKSGLSLPVALAADGTGNFTGAFSTVKYEAGTLEVTAKADGKRPYRRFLWLTSPKRLEERTETRARPEAFLAFTPPAHLHTPESLPALGEELARLLKRGTSEREFHPAMETPWFLAALIILLMAQWFLRRRSDLF